MKVCGDASMTLQRPLLRSLNLDSEREFHDHEESAKDFHNAVHRFKQALWVVIKSSGISASLRASISMCREPKRFVGRLSLR